MDNRGSSGKLPRVISTPKLQYAPCPTASASWKPRASSAPAASGRLPCGRSSSSCCPPATSTTTRAACAALRWGARPTPTAPTSIASPRRRAVHLPRRRPDARPVRSADAGPSGPAVEIAHPRLELVARDLPARVALAKDDDGGIVPRGAAGPGEPANAEDGGDGAEDERRQIEQHPAEEHEQEQADRDHGEGPPDRVHVPLPLEAPFLRPCGQRSDQPDDPHGRPRQLHDGESSLRSMARAASIIDPVLARGGRRTVA